MGTKLNGFQLVELGLAHFVVRSSDLPQLEEEIACASEKSLAEIQELIKKFSIHDSQKGKIENEEEIGKLFGYDNFSDFWKNLQENQSEIAKQIREEIVQLCPLSIRVNFEILQRPLNSSDRSQCYL